MVSNAAYVLYYIRRDFFPDKNIDFEKIKNRSESSPLDPVPPTTITAGVPQTANPHQQQPSSSIGYFEGTTDEMELQHSSNNGASSITAH